MAPSPAQLQRHLLPPPPSARMLVDPEYLMEELLREAMASQYAQAGGPQGGERSALADNIPVLAMGGIGSARRQMQFRVVRLQGLMYDWNCSRVAQQIYSTYSDPDLDGVLLEVNTGGGLVSAAQMVHGAIAGGPKPVVTYAHYAASGGIMGTSASVEVIASGELSRFGSIGAMMTLPKWMAKLWEDYFQEIYADTSPEKNAAWREYTANMKTDRFRAMLNEIDDVFMRQVISDRSLKGGTWLAQESKRRGLIDSIGNFDYAIKRLASRVADQLT